MRQTLELPAPDTMLSGNPYPALIYADENAAHLLAPSALAVL